MWGQAWTPGLSSLQAERPWNAEMLGTPALERGRTGEVAGAGWAGWVFNKGTAHCAAAACTV